MKSLQKIIETRQKFIDGVKANGDAINMELFEDIYPDKAHIIYELLQNAEDQSATSVQFFLSKDKFVFEHDGNPFDYEDVDSITGINHSKKSNKSDKIGRFGIGFKAAFVYTKTPRIWSPSYAFEISEMVLPSELALDPDLGARTRFEFPFNSNKSQDRAFSEIQGGLEEISERTLVFLSCIKNIQWLIEGSRERRLLRIQSSDHHLEILRKIDGRPTESHHFLRYREAVDELERQNVAIAFELKPRSGEQRPDTRGAFVKQFRIVPAEPGCVAVYFTAAKETSNLRFHLHAPFVPELSRSSIKDTPANEPLFRRLAGLTARSLCRIRDLGLLDRDFLGVLPNSQDGISGEYSAIRNAVVGSMKELPLTPTHVGTHAPARRLLQAEAGLKDLLDRDDIRFLTGVSDDRNHRYDWAIAATQRSNRIDRFLEDLDIKKWGVEQFINTLNDRFHDWRGHPDPLLIEWMHKKTFDWHRKLYSLLYQSLEGNLDRLKRICLVRRSDGEYKTGSECYFPTPETREDPLHPRVAADTFEIGGSELERKHAKAFLEDIGVREIGEREQVEAVLKKRYADPADPPSWRTHISDLKRFIELVEEDKNAANLFKKCFIFQQADGNWGCPNQLYLDSPYLSTDLKSYYEHPASDANRTALSDSYRTINIPPSRIGNFAQACGAADRLEVMTVDCKNNPEKDRLYNAPGSISTCWEIDRDFIIHELQIFLENPTFVLSRLIWNTLTNRTQGNDCILKAVYQRNKRHKPHCADSQLVHQLRNAAWVPQGNNETFVRPAEATVGLLPDGFPFDTGYRWLEAIHFGKATRGRAAQTGILREAAAKLGWPGDDKTLNDVAQFAILPSEIRRKALASFADHDSPAELPTHTPGNPGRRAEKVREAARKAPERTKEERPRSLSVYRDPFKRERVDPYLLDLYTRSDGVPICQVCQDSLPFKLPGGKYYFEAVEFLPELNKHQYQNYLILCPNHAAMFKHANNSSEKMKDTFTALEGNKLPIALAEQPMFLYFTNTHVLDLKTVIDTDGEK